jgi:hypothetical protein
MSIQNAPVKAARWLAHELGLATMRSAGKDVWVLILSRYIRLFAYGAVALILALFFQEQGFSDEQIGLFMTLTLLGDVGHAWPPQNPLTGRSLNGDIWRCVCDDE